MRFLVIDRDAVFASVLTKILQRMGHETAVCLSGEEALSVIAETDPDIAALDSALSDLDVMTLATQLRSRYPRTRLMLLTQRDEARVEPDGVLIHGVLSKAAPLADLPLIVQAVIDAPAERPVALTESAHPHTAVADDADIELLVGSHTTSANQDLTFERLLAELAKDLNADGVLLVRSGQLAAWAGALDLTHAELIAATVTQDCDRPGSGAPGREWMRYENDVAGNAYVLYTVSVAAATFLAAVVWEPVDTSWVRQRCRSMAASLGRLLAAQANGASTDVAEGPPV